MRHPSHDSGLRLVEPGARDPRAEDTALVRALVTGDRAATGELWQRHAPMVRGIVRRMLGPDAEVEDLLQEIFLAFMRLVPRLRDPGGLRLYLIKITTNQVRALLRFRRVRRLLVPVRAGELPEATDHSADAEARLALVRFYRVLDTLSAHERTIFTLRFIEELPLGEVAEAAGVSLATVKRHLARASERVFARVDADPFLTNFLDSRGIVRESEA